MFHFHISEFLLAFFTSAVIIYFLQPRAVHIGLVDKPSERKIHDNHTPLIGGIAIFTGFVLTCLTLDLPLGSLRTFFAASFILVFVGVLDDFHELSARARFGAQIIAATMMSVWGGVMLTDMGALTWDGSLFTLGVMALPITVFATVGVINALNMCDGMDGLSGSLVLVVLIGLGVVAWQAGDTNNLALLLLLACSVAGFLAFNIRVGKKRASVFLGDAGSMFLGFALAWFVISFSQGAERSMTPVTALWFLLVPLFDTVGIMLRRIVLKKSPFAADREHMHHVLLAAGFSVNQTLAIMVSIALLAMGFGLYALQAGFSEMNQFMVFLGIFAVYFVGLMLCWHKGCLFTRKLNPYIQERRAGVDRRQLEVQASWIGKQRRVRISDRRKFPVRATETGRVENKEKVKASSRL